MIAFNQNKVYINVRVHFVTVRYHLQYIIQLLRIICVSTYHRMINLVLFLMLPQKCFLLPFSLTHGLERSTRNTFIERTNRSTTQNTQTKTDPSASYSRANPTYTVYKTKRSKYIVTRNVCFVFPLKHRNWSFPPGVWRPSASRFDVAASLVSSLRPLSTSLTSHISMLAWPFEITSYLAL